MSSPRPSWPSPVKRTTVEILVKPLEVSRVSGRSSQCSTRIGKSATREYVSSVPVGAGRPSSGGRAISERSEEHTSELQSRQYLVCRLLLEKKKDSDVLTCRWSMSSSRNIVSAVP